MKNRGFTLIELSIVLVIIGLIVGGVLVGRDLIRASENRAFVAQLEKFSAAANAFKLKYGCVPGDCANATSLGFTGNGNGTGLVTSLYNGTITLDNTNGASSPSSIPFTLYNVSTTLEAQYFWKHLQSANLVSDLTTINTIGNAYSDTMGMAKNDGMGILVGAWNGKNYFHSGVINFGAGWGSQGLVQYALNFSPSDANYVFSKIDGAKLTLGNTLGAAVPDALTAGNRIIVSSQATNGDYYSAATQGAGGASADYCINTSVTPSFFNVANPKKLCSLIIRADF